MTENEFKLVPTQFKAKTEALPARFQFMGKNEIPIFEIEHIPEKTGSLAITLIDEDAPGAEMIYWIVYNLPKDIDRIDPITILLGEHGINSVYEKKYYGPHAVEGKHRYEFILHALDIEDLQPPSDIKATELLKMIEAHSIKSDKVETYVEITGSYAFA